MKFLFIVGTLNAAGTETYLLRFLKYLNKKNDISVLCRCGKKGVLYEEYKLYCSSIDIFRLGITNPIPWIRFYRYLKKNNFDVVCDFGGTFAGLNIFISTICRIPRRIIFYRYTCDFPNQKIFFIIPKIKTLKYLGYKYATSILANSNMAFDVFFKNKTDDRFKVIYNGVEESIFNIDEPKKSIRRSLGISNDCFVIGHTARYAFEKNHKTIIKVAEKICKEYNHIVFVFCGKDVKENLKNVVIEKKLEKNVIFLGERNDVPRVLKAFDAFYFPSTSEGQPNALIEAMFSKLPIVTSNIPSIIETIPDYLLNQCVHPTDHDAASKLLIDIYKGNYNGEYLTSTYKYVC
jgi:glycosyltransferase involved in cell wall biosynthesis